LHLRSSKTGTEHSIPEKIIPMKEAVTQAGDAVAGEAKIGPYIACITKEIHTT
jgi:hypothetical protein